MKSITRIPILKRSTARRATEAIAATAICRALWRSPASFYREAQERISLSDDGWSVSTRPPRTSVRCLGDGGQIRGRRPRSRFPLHPDLEAYIG